MTSSWFFLSTPTDEVLPLHFLNFRSSVLVSQVLIITKTGIFQKNGSGSKLLILQLTLVVPSFERLAGWVRIKVNLTVVVPKSIRFVQDTCFSQAQQFITQNYAHGNMLQT